jgi:outer membrane protein OmpA-like peptidoglycan-associated protein
MGLKKVLVGAAAAVALTAGAANAGAFDRDGWYMGLEAGWVRVNETELPGSGIVSLTFQDGWGGFATAGYAFHDSRWRLEGELGFRQNDIDEINGFAVTDGDLVEWSGMLNAVYDIPLRSERLGLAVGVGVGIDNPRLGVGVFEDNDKVFAAQGIVGLTYRVGQHTDLMVNYRAMWADPADLALGIGVQSEMDIFKHTVTVGFRYGYEDPPAPPVVVTQPEPPKAGPKQFIIFFGFNKCNITAEADAVLSEAAAAAKSGGSASVRIVGHTDTVGSNSYNQKLSECRANAAKANMVGKGVSEGSISTSGKGESELMVQTGDGVKEPQNRRANINID